MRQTTLLLPVVILLATPANGPGQEIGRETDAPAAIAGYRSLGWGADSATVTERFGPPDTVRRVESLDAVALVYAAHELGRTRGAIGFLVNSRHGFIRAMYLAEYGGGESCLAMYQDLRDAVGALLPDVPMNETMVNESEGLPFCTAFQLGGAGARTVWQDPNSLARAWIALDLRAGVVRVSFEAPAFEAIGPDAEG